MAHTIGQYRRKRSRMACEPCRERKRRCNGGTPCSTCSSWGYDCYYHNPPRSRQESTRHIPDFAGTLPEPPAPSRKAPYADQPPTPDTRGFAQSLEANSGAAFVRKIGLKIDPTNAPKLNLFSWNVGARRLSSGVSTVSALPIVDIISLENMKSLATAYFAKVDPCYGFIDSRVFFERLNARWRLPSASNRYDGVLAGVAALGSLFSHRSINITEVHLVELARSLLNEHMNLGAPSVDVVTAWTLRVVYLRMTATPYPTWIASSTLMHLIEAANLHQESHPETEVSGGAQCDADIRRRLVGVAQHLNLWISYDLGLSRVSFFSDPLVLPSPKAGDFTAELLGLLPASASLGPEHTQNDKDLEMLLLQTLKGSHAEPPSVLAQCNLVLCLVRRIRMTNLATSSGSMEQVLKLFKRSLCAVRNMMLTCCPWHHAANVPFHMISILLEMDTSAALGILPDAMETLKLVAATYDTDTMREAYSTARLLVLLYQRRRCEDATLLSGILEKHQQAELNSPPQQAPPTSEELSWVEGLVADMPAFQGVDLYHFLQADLTRVSQDAYGVGGTFSP
ncbi:hypothetical protein BBP40_011073 [Aspergillus hancockii]|nr:hypothetical protein BBP40_011073 [Aspergillus hancockii]